MIRRFGRILLLGVVAAAPFTQADHIALERVRLEALPESERVQNGGFEEGDAAPLPKWWAWGEGYEIADGDGRDASRALRCVQKVTTEQHGAGQTIELNQKTARGLVASGWSRAREVDGTPNAGYSVYLDIEYMDSTFLWGQAGYFSTGTHDWEFRRLLIEPVKPIRRVTIYPLFRGHSGTAWFDDFSLVELPETDGVHFFEGVPVRPLQRENSDNTPSDGPSGCLGEDGIALYASAQSSLLVSAGRELGRGGPLIFVRDVAADSDLLAPDRWLGTDLGSITNWEGWIAPLQIDVKVHLRQVRGTLMIQVDTAERTGADRAITVYFAIPLSGAGWTWWEDMRRSIAAENGVYANTLPTGAGATGRRSRYPLAALTRGDIGIALAMPINDPRHHRLGFDAENGMLYAAFDVGLSTATEKPPGEASFRAFLYAFDGRKGFRGALDMYYILCRESFERRVRDGGLWMAFTDISTVPGWEDFGFAFHEGTNNVPWDAAHDILSFVYTEPMTTWLPLPEDVPRTYEGAMDYLRASAGGDDVEAKRRGAKTLTSSIQGADGRSILSLENAPWCNGAVFALNADPDIPVSREWPLRQADFALDEVQRVIAEHDQPRADGAPPARVDGTYIDSYEFWANSMDFNRDHFGAADLPLVYDTATHRLGVLTVFATFEFQKELARRMREQDRLMMANGVLNQYEFPAAYLDVLGTETNWFPQGRWEPLSDAELCFRRAMSYQRPYCFLLNTHYADLTLELTERYMQRCLFWGMFPGFFSENAATNCYFATPEWYEPARPLFKKYVPLIQRIAAAGWEPVTHAQSRNGCVLIERFGKPEAGPTYFTVLNETDSPVEDEVAIDLAQLHLTDREIDVTEVVNGEPCTVKRDSGRFAIGVSLPAYAGALYEVRKNED